MSTIKEIADELTNLTVQEVNELAMIMKHDTDIPAVHYNDPKYNHYMSPKEYGQRKICKKHRV